MELLLWLLLPVAAASGWFAARRSLASQAETTSRKLSSHYLKGLNYLLNEQPDKAIDVFIKLIDVDSETVDTHLALGVLFRRRGEVNRAIRLHQNLVARADLRPQQRSLAMLELGQDYQRAGLFDRAEALFRELIQTGHHRLYAYRQLLDIYQQEHDWEQAILAAQELERLSGESYKPVLAHYYCEQAEQFRRQGHLQRSRQALRHALAIDPACVRASLAEGGLALGERDTASAIQAFQRVERQDSRYLPEVIQPLHQCYHQDGRYAEFADYLRYLLERYGGASSMLALADLIREHQGEQQALNFVIQQLKQRPSLHGLARFVEIKLLQTEDPAQDNLFLFKQITAQLLAEHPVYRCLECGFTGKTLHWQCPSCKRWATIKPIQGLYGE